MSASNETAPPAVVIGLNSITGLQTARILARRGVPVIALADDLKHYCCRTRVCRRILHADTTSEELIQRLEEIGPQLRDKAVLFPCSDLSVLLCAQHARRLAPWYHVDLPPAETVEQLMDKKGCYDLAVRHGISVPPAFFLSSKADARHAAGQLRFPCVLKPPLKTPLWERNARKAYKLHNAAELLDTYDRCCHLVELLMVQEWVGGDSTELYSCNCYYDAKSRPLVTFVAHKLRQWPHEVGTACLAEECENDFVLRESLRLFDAVHYRGLGYVEMKYDGRRGTYYLIEPNVGRPTGRSANAEAAGVELLYTKYCDNVGWPLPETRAQSYHGAKWIHWRRDLQSSYRKWRRGELTLRQWWGSTRGMKGFAVYDASDWGPFLAELHYAAGRILRPKKYQAEQ